MNSLVSDESSVLAFLMRFGFLIVLLYSCLAFSQGKEVDSTPQLQIEKNQESQLPSFFTGFLQNTTESFQGSNLYFHLAAVAVTPGIIATGIDASVYDHFKHSPNGWAWPGAVLASGAGAAVASGWLYLSNDKKSIGASYAILHATVITAIYIRTLKLITGRSHPTKTNPATSREQSESFDFGGFNFKTGYGWPSGHMSHTVAVMSALSNYYPEKKWIRNLGYILAGYMLYTVSAHDYGQMHWFSDGVAGALIGYAIGTTVGKNMKMIFEDESQTDQLNAFHFEWLPVVDKHYMGLNVQIQY